MSDAPPDEAEKLRQMSHRGITAIGNGSSAFPCVTLDGARFNGIMDRVAGRPVSVDTNLNVRHDGRGNVFVDVSFTFSLGGISEKILVDARRHREFFELMARHSVIALSSSVPGESRIFMIQLPKPDRVKDALDVIRGALLMR